MATVRITATDWVRVDGDGMTLWITGERSARSVAGSLGKSGDPDNIDISAAIFEALDGYRDELLAIPK